MIRTLTDSYLSDIVGMFKHKAPPKQVTATKALRELYVRNERDEVVKQLPLYLLLQQYSATLEGKLESIFQGVPRSLSTHTFQRLCRK